MLKMQKHTERVCVHERERDGITNAHLLDDIHFLMGFHVKPLYKNVNLQSLVQ